MTNQIEPDLVYDVIYATTHVYATYSVRVTAERPVREPRTFFPLPDHKYLPPNLTFSPTSMDERFFCCESKGPNSKRVFQGASFQTYFLMHQPRPRLLPWFIFGDTGGHVQWTSFHTPYPCLSPQRAFNCYIVIHQFSPVFYETHQTRCMHYSLHVYDWKLHGNNGKKWWRWEFVEQQARYIPIRWQRTRWQRQQWRYTRWFPPGPDTANENLGEDLPEVDEEPSTNMDEDKSDKPSRKVQQFDNHLLEENSEHEEMDKDNINMLLLGNITKASTS